jgi:hypothetical protein
MSDDTTFTLVDELLRDRSGFLERIERDPTSPQLARALIGTIAIGAAAFGAVLGAHRGGLQIAYAAAKLPLSILLTAGLCTPALNALDRVASRTPSAIRRDLALVLGSLALASLVLIGLAPVLLLAISFGADYHAMILATVISGLISGGLGLGLFAAGIRARAGSGHGFALAASLALFALVGAQMSWTLRPYLVRPRAVEVPFVRSIEGSFVESVGESFDSARGVYHREAAPLPGQSEGAAP